VNQHRLFALLTVLATAGAGCLFPMSMQAAREAHEAELARRCADPQVAYEAGHNSGMKRKSLETGWVDTHCLPEARPSVRESYLAGYEAGASLAPQVVEVRGLEASYRAGGTCTFNSDCGEGMSCRSWHGDNVCMGYGGAGAPCWFNKDCLSDRCDDKVCR
jgi:hypothetical protein